MVRKIRTDDEGLQFEYFNETSVGEGGNNKRRTDNLLVQLFLRQFYGKNPTLFTRLPKPRNDPQANVIVLDGDVGGQTKAGIRVFQEFVKKLTGGADVIVDGRVSVPTGLVVPGTKSFFIIDQLNSFFFTSSPFNMRFNEGLHNHPIVQSLPELRDELIALKAGQR